MLWLPESVCVDLGAQEVSVSEGGHSSVSVQLVVTDTRCKENTAQALSVGAVVSGVSLTLFTC